MCGKDSEECRILSPDSGWRKDREQSEAGIRKKKDKTVLIKKKYHPVVQREGEGNMPQTAGEG